MVRIVWTDLAIDDLKSIHSYISQDSKNYADSFVEKIILKVELLEIYPNSGRVVPEFNIDKIRELLEGNYRIIYKINSDSISIARVHHAARQLTGL